jgi:hypothetical protein
MSSLLRSAVRMRCTAAFVRPSSVAISVTPRSGRALRPNSSSTSMARSTAAIDLLCPSVASSPPVEAVLGTVLPFLK